MNTATDAQAVLLEARAIRLGYRQADRSQHAVLTNFSLRLHAGEVIAILGPSGVGKSSLLRVLAGLQTADHGCVQVHGQTLHGPHPRVGLVFQDPCLLPWLDLEANVRFGLDFKHQPTLSRAQRNQRVAAAIDEVDLAAARRRHAGGLSGGMKQRVALARAIARQPDILLLDEPFSALDEVTRAEMHVLLRTIIANHGTAAILVTHDIDEALVLADLVVLLGGQPATTQQQWSLAQAHPRDPTIATLTQTRVDILRGMRTARSTLSAHAASLPVSQEAA